MTDRVLVYDNENPWTTDVLQAEKNSYAAIGKLTAALLGYSTFINGLVCTPDIPPSLNVVINPGEIYSPEPIDTTPYGSGGTPYEIPADSHVIMKQGISYDDVFLPITPPITAGYSQKYLVQVQFTETDDVPVLRPFYNAASQTVNTIRKDLITIETKAGVPAATGSETVPTPDAGFIGLWIVTVTNGQTAIISSDIESYPDAPFIGGDYGITLPLMLTQAAAASTYLTQANAASIYLTQAAAAATYLTQAAAAATYTVRPNVNTNGYFAQGDGNATAISTSPTQLELLETGGQEWISGNNVTIPFNGQYNIVCTVEITCTTVTPDTITLYIDSGGTTLGVSSITFQQSGTLPFQVNAQAFLTAGDLIRVYASQDIASATTVRIIFFNITAIAN